MSDSSSITQSRIRTGVYILLTILAAFLILTFVAIIKDIIIQYQGKIATATVIKVPLVCKSKTANSIEITINNKPYAFAISRSECVADKYKVGMQFQVRKHPDFERVIRVDDRPDYMLGLYIAWLAVFLLVIRYFWRRYKKKQENIKKAL